MSDPAITARPLETQAEKDAFFRLAVRTFGNSSDPDSDAAGWQRYVESIPGFEPRQARGAFRGDRFLGGYLIYERRLRIGAAHLPTVCIGAVVAHPDERGRGVGRAMMQDAIAYALEHRHALLLLNGIPNFYHRFGYIDVVDVAWHGLEPALVQAQPPSACGVRVATVEDAPAILALYQRHYAPYAGRFDRTLAQQEHQLVHASPDRIWLATTAAGEATGYLVLPRRPGGAHADEAIAESWPAVLALLQHHAAQLAALPDPPAELHWPLPLDSLTFQLLADHFPIRSEIHSRPNTDWMARVGHVPALLHALLPAWEESWRRAGPAWSVVLTLAVDGQAAVLHLEPGGVRLDGAQSERGPRVELTGQALVQLLFGARLVAWAARKPGQQIPDELIPALEALFPAQPAWIAGSDFF